MKFVREKSKSWTKAVIDMTPLIDVVFILLLFFLLTAAPTPDPQMAVRLPKATSGSVERTPKEINLVLKSSGDVFIKGHKVSMEMLSVELNKIAKKSPETKVILRGDKKAYYEKFIKLLEKVNAANLALAVAVDNSPENKK